MNATEAQLSSDEQAAIEAVKISVHALNIALANANEVQLKVDLRSVTVTTVGRNNRNFYIADFVKIPSAGGGPLEDRLSMTIHTENRSELEAKLP